MTNDDARRKWEEITEWAEGVLDEEARAEEHLTDGELHDRAVIGDAQFWMLTDGWLITHPDNPEMRAYLIDDEQYSEEHADAVLAKMRELGKAQGLL